MNHCMKINALLCVIVCIYLSVTFSYLSVSEVSKLEQVGEVTLQRLADLLPRRVTLRQRTQTTQRRSAPTQGVYEETALLLLFPGKAEENSCKQAICFSF